MKSLTLILAATAALATAAAFSASAQQAPNGADLFSQRCAACHEGGSAPAKSVLAAHTPAQIVDILTNGVMAPMASGLSDAEKQAIAGYLSQPATPAASAAPAAPAPAAPQAQPAAADGQALFGQRCAVCHEGGSGPSKAQLATHTPSQIVDILTNGVMAPMAAGLSDTEKQAIAGYLTNPAAAPGAPATNAPATNAPATPATNAPGG
ncbi:MAG TPA: cytochrome c [Caulobacteraceae bacterium]|nr:cytochrome c [Caulobacteraceae bacterium]